MLISTQRLQLVALAALILTASLDVVAGESAEAAEITLTFAWPIGTRIAAQTVSTRELRGASSIDVVRSVIDYAVEVGSAGSEGTIVKHTLSSSPTVTRNGQAVVLPDLLATAVQGQSTLVVDRNGQFLRISGGESIRDLVKQAMSKASGRETLTAEARKLIESLLADEVLAQVARNEWQGMVGTWVGRTFEPGWYETQAPTQLPLPGLPAVEFASRIEVRGPVACSGEMTEARCVHLNIEAKPVEAQLRSVVARFMKDLARAFGLEGELKIKDFTMTTKALLITEIDTLLPHRVAGEKELSLIFETPDGRTHSKSQVHRRSTVYKYQTVHGNRRPTSR